jgi:hypothetical protein
MITKLKIAEVLNTGNSFTHSDNTEFDDLRITVRTISDVNVRIYENVRPANLHDLSIPLPGEHVLIFKGLRQESNVNVRRYDWYYLTTYALQTGINNNLLPGVTYNINNTASNKELSELWKLQILEKSINLLQPYPGDRIIQGRWGNRFRLGSTLKDQDTVISKPPPWKRGSGADGDPIIVLSNTKTSNNNGFITENLNADYSSLYLTSTQELPGYTVTKSLKQENGYQSQFIGVADRINLNAKTDSVTINAPNNIELNTDKVVFGTQSKKEPGIYSTELWNVLNNILNVLSIGFKSADNTVIMSAIDTISLNEACTQLNNILNNKIQQDKREQL